MTENVRRTTILFIYVVTHFGYMFLCNYIGQLVIDYSEDIFKKM